MGREHEHGRGTAPPPKRPRTTTPDQPPAPRSAHPRTAGNSAVTPLVTVSLTERLDRAAQLMAESGNAHLGVIDPRTGRAVGVLSTLDIARAISEGETEA